MALPSREPYHQFSSRYVPDIEARTKTLLKLIADGDLDGREFGEGHWRLFLPGQETTGRTCDYWPRTGTFYPKRHGFYKRSSLITTFREAIEWLQNG